MDSNLTQEERKKIYEEEKARMEAQEQIKHEKQEREGLGYILLLIPIVSSILMYFWVGNMVMLQNPGSFLNLLGIGTIILTAVLASVEASQLGFGKGAKKESSPAAIFLGMVLLWIIVFPYYLYARSKKGKKNLIFGGIIVALIFVAIYVLMSSAINSQLDNIRNLLK